MFVVGEGCVGIDCVVGEFVVVGCGKGVVVWLLFV